MMKFSWKSFQRQIQAERMEITRLPIGNFQTLQGPQKGKLGSGMVFSTIRLKIIPTRQVKTRSKLFCIDRLIPFGFIWYQLSQSYGGIDFLLSKNYQGVLSIAEVCNLDYLYHTMLNVSIICHHNLFVYHHPYHAIFSKAVSTCRINWSQ